ncbi:MAG: glycosyltransferase, partial [Candidatus Binatia bacterium]
MQLSIVIPIFNEEENIEPLIREIDAVVAPLAKTYEIVAVDDGSKDGTFAALRRVFERRRGSKIVRLRRNFGQTAALAAGLAHADGEIIVLMDGDGQN